MKMLLLVLLPLSLLSASTLVDPTPALPPQLAGQWQQHEVSFVARRVLTAEEQEYLNDSVTADLNTQLRQGQATILLALNTDGSYHYSRASRGITAASEAGTCRLSRDTLYLRPEAHTAVGLLPPMLRVVRVSRRVLVLEFPFGSLANKMVQQQLYHRQ